MAIKVLHIITRLILGGAQENTLATVMVLSMKDDYEVSLVTGPPIGPEGSLMDEARIHGIEPFLIPEMRREINPVRDFLSFVKLYLLILREKYDIVHTHSSKAGILGRLAGKLAGVKIIIHTIHGLPFHPYQNKFLNLLYIILEKFTAYFTDMIITVCDAMKKKAVSAGIAGEGKFTTIYSGMDLTPFLEIQERREELSAPSVRNCSGRPARHLAGGACSTKAKQALPLQSTYTKSKFLYNFGIKEGELVIGKIGRLFPLKGHKYLIQAAPGIVKVFPNVKFLLIGDGILKNKLKSEVNQLGLEDKFIFLGLVKREDIPGLISVMDILVHTSLREGLARVLPQAMACGKPVVSFDIDGASEVVIQGKTGFLVPPEDTKSLSSAIINALSNPERLSEMGQAGQLHVDPAFRVETMVDKIDELYQELLFTKACHCQSSL